MKIPLIVAFALGTLGVPGAAWEKGAAPPGMAWIAGGTFTMGSDAPESQGNERPAREVGVDGFWIDTHDVTNAEFRRFVEATGYVTTAERPVDWDELKKQLPPDTPKPPADRLVPGSMVFTPSAGPVDLDNLRNWWRWVPGASWRHPEGLGSDLRGRGDHPVVQVSWDDAVAYAKWVGKRLPTEAEWEFAARGSREGKRYAWGDEFQPGGKFMANTWTGDFPYRNTAADGYAGTSPVQAFPPNGYGLYDMGGNVWNWCDDRYHPGAYVQAASGGIACCSASPSDAANEHVIKGGSFLCSPSYCESYRPSARRGEPADTGMSHIGFRCALSGAGPGLSSAVSARP